MKIKFTKMQAYGNDYVYIDAINQKIEKPNELAKYVSDRHFAIGSDGMVMICPSEVADFRMRMFNPDGTEGEMCGNALRSMSKYVYDHKFTDKTKLTIETLGGIQHVELFIKDGIAVNIKANEYDFKANGQSIKFKGFMKLYVETKDQDNGEDDELLLPSLELNQKLKNEKIDIKQSFTEPPPRYTEASIVKVLEEKGIGRPSTYAPTISTILDRRYIEKEQKQLVPTDLGKIVNKLLVENFSDVINVAFTAKIEEEFDEIAEGKENWKEVISEFYGPFEENVERVEKELEHVQLVEEVSDVPCEKCGRMMVIKYGRYGKFLACPGFPECRNAKPIIETIDVPCPVCGGTVQVKKSRRGRKFYVCENNPESCQYISWNIPKVGEKWEPKEDKPDAEKKKTVKKKVAKKTTSKKKTTKKK